LIEKKNHISLFLIDFGGGSDGGGGGDGGDVNDESFVDLQLFLL